MIENVNLFNLSEEQFGNMDQICKHGVPFDLTIFLGICLKEIDMVHKYMFVIIFIHKNINIIFIYYILYKYAFIKVNHNAIYHKEKLETTYMSNTKG